MLPSSISISHKSRTPRGRLSVVVFFITYHYSKIDRQTNMLTINSNSINFSNTQKQVQLSELDKYVRYSTSINFYHTKTGLSKDVSVLFFFITYHYSKIDRQTNMLSINSPSINFSITQKQVQLSELDKYVSYSTSIHFYHTDACLSEENSVLYFYYMYLE